MCLRTFHIETHGLQKVAHGLKETDIYPCFWLLQVGLVFLRLSFVIYLIVRGWRKKPTGSIMIALPSNNKCSELSVFPKNWKNSKADIKKPWYISYRFYSKGQVKRIEIRGMNAYKEYKARRTATEGLLDFELSKLKSGYNPITSSDDELETLSDLNQYTPLNTALQLGAERLNIKHTTKKGVLLVVKRLQDAATVLRLHRTPIAQIKRRNLIDLIEQTFKMGVKNSANNFNHYRRYLGMVFSELVQSEAIEQSPIDKHFKKRQTVKKLRDVLTDEERKLVDQALMKYPDFRRFVHIFYHSGARITELLKVQGIGVDLVNQRYKTTILKGKQQRETWRVIKDVALPYWKEIDFKPMDYLFSVGMKPGPTPITPNMITRRWRKYVIQDLGINKGFYSLKHLNTSETVDLLNEQEAAKLNAHTSTEMVKLVYDVKSKIRKDEKLKGLKNKFA